MRAGTAAGAQLTDTIRSSATTVSALQGNRRLTLLDASSFIQPSQCVHSRGGCFERLGLPARCRGRSDHKRKSRCARPAGRQQRATGRRSECLEGIAQRLSRSGILRSRPLLQRDSGPKHIEGRPCRSILDMRQRANAIQDRRVDLFPSCDLCPVAEGACIPAGRQRAPRSHRGCSGEENRNEGIHRLAGRHRWSARKRS